jgi:DedD protein
MDAQLKQRVVGAAVLVAIGVVFIPIFLDETSEDQDQALPFGIESEPPGDFNSRVVPLDDDTMDRLERAMDSTPEELGESRISQDPPRQVPVPTPKAAGSPREATAPVAETRTGVTAWVVQLGSFSSEENAIGLIERLKKKGYTVFIEPSRDDGKVTYRVRVGPELTKVVADRIRDKLANDVDIEGLVMRYP